MSLSTCSGSGYSGWSISTESSGSPLDTPDVPRRLFPESGEESDNSLEALEVLEAPVKGGASLKSPLLGSDAVALPLRPAGAADAAGGRVHWEAFFVLLPIFCGYATLFGLQHEIKVKFGIADDSSTDSHSFSFATSFLYIFNLLFRFGHSIVFGGLTPRERVFVSMVSMAVAMLIVAIPIMTFGWCCFFWLALAYSLGGVAVGCFESNFLCCLTPLGHRTKHIAITAIPVGVTTILVGAFILMGPPLHVPAVRIYLGVAALVFCGAIIMSFRIPQVQASGENGSLRPGVADRRSGLGELADHGRRWRSWLPQLWHYPIAFAMDQFALAVCNPGVALFMYDQPTVVLAEGFTLPTNSFFAVVNSFSMLGGLTGRWSSYRIKPRHPLVYSLLTAAGVSIILLRIPQIAPLGSYCVSLGDGLIYGTTSRYIDTSVPHEFNLTAISFWLFIGDFGSVTGSNLISYIRDWVVGT